MTPAALHSSDTDRWGTPDSILGPARATLGYFGLDPASDADFNRRVGAGRYLTEAEDGLTAYWPCGGTTVFLNPPGGKRAEPGATNRTRRSLTQLFWSRLMRERAKGSFLDAVFVGFSLECLQTTQGYAELPIGAFPFCIPSSRTAFVRPDGSPGKSPSHSNVVVYVPGTYDRTAAFRANFQHLGTLVNT